MMAFAWSAYADVAESLLDRPPSGVDQQAVWRTAVSRSYYAAFGTLAEFHERHSGFRRQPVPDEHKALQDLMAGQDDWEEAADQLADLRRWRNKADYRPADSIDKRKAQSLLEVARELIGLAVDAGEDGAVA